MIPSLFFANPWGLAALAAVPALVAIHFLQERSRRVRTATLFLLERAAPLPTGGMRLEKFRNSLPFWMQLLAILALTWLLADPRWVRSDSRQTVVVVLDSSASMEAFRVPTVNLIAKRLSSWDALASRTDWHLLETGPGRPPLYAGRSLTELLDAAKGWRPVLGTHDFSASLAIATALVPGDAGVVILVTDRPTPLPGGVAVLSAGEPFENVGFSGGDVDRADEHFVWRALVTNHGDTPQEREFSAGIVSDTGTPVIPGQSKPIRLEPRQSRTIEGPWPEGAKRVVLALSEDRFGLDDALPLVRPVPRIVRVAITIRGPTADLLGRMVRATDGVEIVTDPATADLIISWLDPSADTDGIQVAVTDDDPAGDEAGDTPVIPSLGDGITQTRNAGRIDERTPSRQPAAYDPAWVTAEDHPLVRDLGWGGLMSGPVGDVTPTPVDEPLLWKSGRPLALVRSKTLPGGRRVQHLVMNFDVAGSTAARSPGVVVLVQRFIDRIRAKIERPWADNFETGQSIDMPPGLAGSTAGRGMMTVANIDGDLSPAPSPFRGRAPWGPGFFTVSASGEPSSSTPVVTGATHFADSRESDFRKAAPADTLEAIRMEQAIKQSIEDPWAPLWLGIAIGALLVAWVWRTANARVADSDFALHPVV